MTIVVEDSKSFDILNNAAKRYSNELKSFADDVTCEVVDQMYQEYPVLNLPEITNFNWVRNAKKFSKKIQSWKGIVISHTEITFQAKLYDLNIGGTYEFGEFDKEDISPEDLNLLSEGAVFYWSVGHYMENGQSVKRSDLRFQRLITLDSDDFDYTKLNIERKYGNLKERKIDD